MQKLYTETLEARSLLAAASDKSYWESFTDLASSALNVAEPYAPFIKDVQEHPIPAVASGVYAAVSAINAYHAFGHTLSALKNGLPAVTAAAAPVEADSRREVFGAPAGGGGAPVGGFAQFANTWAQNKAMALSAPHNPVLSSHLIEFIESDAFTTAQGDIKEGLYSIVGHMIQSNKVSIEKLTDIQKLSDFLNNSLSFYKKSAHTTQLNALADRMTVNIPDDELQKMLAEVQKAFGIGKAFTSQATLEDTIEFLQDTEEEVKDNGSHIANTLINLFLKGDTTFLSDWGTFIGAGFAVPQLEKLTGNPIHKMFGIDGSMAADSAKKIFKHARFGQVTGAIGSAFQYGFTADALHDNYNDAFDTLVAYEKRGYSKMASDALNFAYYNPATSAVKTVGFMLDNYLFAGLPFINKLTSGTIAEVLVGVGSLATKIPVINPIIGSVGSLVTKIPLIGASLGTIGASVGVIAPVVLALDIAYPLIEDAALRVDKLWNYKDVGYENRSEALSDLSYRFCKNSGTNLSEGWENSKLKSLGTTAYSIGSSVASATWNYGIVPSWTHVASFV